MIYELTYLTTDEETAEATSAGKALVGGTVKSVVNWTGRRKLAYPIKKEAQAFFTTVVFEAETASVNIVRDALAEQTNILRFLLVVHTPQPEESTSRKPRETEKAEEPIAAKTATPAVETPVADEPVAPAKPKKSRAKPTAEEMKALDAKLEELLKEDIAK